jgi:hypothetical protein
MQDEAKEKPLLMRVYKLCIVYKADTCSSMVKCIWLYLPISFPGYSRFFPGYCFIAFISPPRRSRLASMTDVYLLHYILRGIAGMAVSAFFTRIHVIGGENVPRNGPVIV